MGVDGLEALARLEELVERAGEELTALRAENRGLRHQLRELESADGESASGETDRAELIVRIEKLVGGLDEVLSLTEHG